MRKIFIIIGLLFITNFAFGEIYLVIDKTSKQIITASEKNDTVITDGQEIVVLPGKFENIELAQPITDYKYQGKRFVLNQTKIDADNNKKQEAEEKALEEKLIQEKIKTIAIEQLKAEGQVFKHN